MADCQAYVSLAVNDTYATSALVLGDSLRDTKTNRQLALLVTKNVSHVIRARLAKIWDQIIEISNTLNDEYSSSLLERPDLESILTKLKIWSLTQFKKAVFVDADTLVLCNVDELFDRSELSAAPETGWPDCFNSGVLVFVPSLETYNSLVQYSKEHGSFDGNDQGVLNTYFKDWSTSMDKHLPYIYNMVSNICYTYAPAANYFGKSVKIVHFVGSSKPWSQHYDYGQSRVLGTQPEHLRGVGNEYLNLWWNRYHKLKEHFDKSDAVIVADSKVSKMDSERQNHEPLNDHVSNEQKAWERGEIDFTRRDRFTVIQHHLDSTIDGRPIEQEEEQVCDDYEQSFSEDCSEYRVEERFYTNETVPYSSMDGDGMGQVHSEEQSFVYHAQFTWPATVVEGHCQNGTQEPSQAVPEEATDNEPEKTVPVELDADAAARLRWEIGAIDFTGEDSFAKIESYLNSLLCQMEKSLILENQHPGTYDELELDERDDRSSTPVTNETDDSQASYRTSPSILSVADSAYSEVLPREPEKISRATQTSFLCLSKAVQTSFDNTEGET